jgi:hypothetical protein
MGEPPVTFLDGARGFKPFWEPSFRIVADPSMVTTEPRLLSRWERVRVWLEDLAFRSDLVWPFPRVQRTATKPSPEIIRMGDMLVCHPSMVERIRALSR